MLEFNYCPYRNAPYMGPHSRWIVDIYQRYFGDKTEEGGNDFEIARKLRDKGGKVVEVNSWEDTYKCLQKMENGV